MRVAQELVRGFHEHTGQPVADAPTAPSRELAEYRIKIMHEEVVKELFEALRSGDLVEIADALADSLYTILGTAVVCGIEVTPIFLEVHRSNMTKDPMEPGGKPVKGPHFSPARVAELLLLQTAPMQAVSDHVVGLGDQCP